MKHVLSFDVEDWYHGEIISRRTTAEFRFPQVAEALTPVLDLLARENVQATFFVVGELLLQQPELFLRIAADGHEIACHGMSHTSLRDLDANSFADELDAFRHAMSELLPFRDVVGFRAPMFSLNRRTSWALPVLLDAGYRYDSSVFPVRTGYYGIGYAPLGVYHPSLEDPGTTGEGDLLEVPLSVFKMGPLRLPVAGGTYLRIIPFVILQEMLRRIARKRPLVLYAHPFEFFPDTPRRPLPLHERFAIYHNIPPNLGKLERLLKRFEFGPAREALEARELV